MTSSAPRQPSPGLSDHATGPASLSAEELQVALARPAQPARTGSGRRTTTLAAALVTVAALVAVGSAALSRQHSATPGPAAAPAPAAQPLPAAHSSADDTAPSDNADEAGGGSGDGGLLVAPPQGVVWELFEGVAVPTSRTDGPSRVDGPVHSGFSRTPTGALLAAAQIGVRRVVSPDLGGLRAVAAEQLVPGPGRTAYLNLIAGLRGNTPPAGGYAQYVAFRMVAFTPDAAVLTLVTRSPDGVLQAGTDTVRWAGGDWKLELPPSGLQQPQVLNDLTGYVPWSGLS